MLLLDLYMPELDGHAVLAALHDTPHPPAVVVLTSATDDEHLVRAMHAGATSYLLKTAPAEHVIAAVRDTGTGFDPAAPHAGSGLAHIRDRVAELGGTVDIDSAPGRGAALTVRVPVP